MSVRRLVGGSARDRRRPARDERGARWLPAGWDSVAHLAHLLAGMMLLATAGAPSLAAAQDQGTLTRDIASVQISLDGVARIDREIQYGAFLAERGIADDRTAKDRAVRHLADYGAHDIVVDVETDGDRLRLRARYHLPGAAHRRLDDYLAQHILRDPLPVDPSLVVHYPFELEAIRVARVSLPGTLLAFEPYSRQSLAPTSFVENSVRLEEGSTAIVQSRQLIRPGDLVDPSAVDRASVVPLAFSPEYRPTMLHWVALLATAIAAVFQIRLAVPVNRLERATEPFANPLFNVALATVLILFGLTGAVLAFQLGGVPEAWAVTIEQALLTAWPQPAAEVVRLDDLSGVLLMLAIVLFGCGVGLALRRDEARWLTTALAAVLFALVFRVSVTWLPLPGYVPYQLPILFFGGQMALWVLALVVRQLGSINMRRHYAKQQ